MRSLFFVASLILLFGCASGPAVVRTSIVEGPSSQEKDYYLIISQRLESVWMTNLKTKIKKLYDDGLIVRRNTDRKTIVAFSVDDSGQFEKVHIKRSSGLEIFDQAAVDSVKQVAPLPPPPKSMLEKNKTLLWSFVVEGR